MSLMTCPMAYDEIAEIVADVAGIDPAEVEINPRPQLMSYVVDFSVGDARYLFDIFCDDITPENIREATRFAIDPQEGEENRLCAPGRAMAVARLFKTPAGSSA